jgi:hypothetical protein
MTKKDNKESGGIEPVHVNKDVWFYPVGRKLEFTVYIGHKSTLFDINKSLLRKYICPKRKKK